jgi:hypothetical protein
LPEICQSELYVVIRSEPAAAATPEPSLAVIGDQAHDVTHKAYLAMALPPVLVNKPIAGCFGQRFAPLDCCQLLLVSALVAMPLVATGGIGTCAAIAAVLVASADKP